MKKRDKEGMEIIINERMDYKVIKVQIINFRILTMFKTGRAGDEQKMSEFFGNLQKILD